MMTSSLQWGRQHEQGCSVFVEGGNKLGRLWKTVSLINPANIKMGGDNRLLSRLARMMAEL